MVRPYCRTTTISWNHHSSILISRLCKPHESDPQKHEPYCKHGRVNILSFSYSLRLSTLSYPSHTTEHLTQSSLRYPSPPSAHSSQYNMELRPRRILCMHILHPIFSHQHPSQLTCLVNIFSTCIQTISTFHSTCQLSYYFIFFIGMLFILNSANSSHRHQTSPTLYFWCNIWKKKSVMHCNWGNDKYFFNDHNLIRCQSRIFMDTLIFMSNEAKHPIGKINKSIKFIPVLIP